jgi:cobalt/nickel transport protein
MFAALLAPAASGHFNILLPQTASARKGDTVTFLYRFGHPFEHQLFDAPPPVRVVVVAPEGKQTDLGQALEKVQVPGEKKEVTAYRFRLKPEQRGDYTVVLRTPPIWLEEDQEFVQDTVKVVLHVQAQKGWDADTGRQFKIVPLTRPYGLQPGMVFQAQVLGLAKPGLGQPLGKVEPLAGALVEVERFNPTPPAKLPPDEHITRTVKTDPSGVVTTTLPEAGWWAITAQRDGGQRAREGKMYPLRERVTLWVWVDAKADR